MMSKSPQSHQVVEKNGFWLLNPASKSESILLALLILFLPTQFGKHFWPSFSLVSGIRVDYLSPTLYFTDVLMLCLFFVIVSKWRLRTIGHFLRKNSVTVILLIFFLETALFALRPPLGLLYWCKLIEYTFFGFYVAQLFRFQSQLKSLAILFSISSFFESFLAILQYASQSSLNGWLYFLGERTFNGSTPGIANASLDGALILRPYATFSHPNVLAAYLVLSSVLITFYLVRKNHGFLRFYGIGVLSISGIALLLTLSRSTTILWFALLCALLISYVFKKRSYRKGLVVALIVGSLLSFVFVPFLQHLFTRFSETTFTEEALTQRVQLLADAVTIVKQHPITGVGLGNFIPALSPLAKPLSLSLYLQPVHNIFFLVVTETGLLGVALFLWLLVRTYVQLLNKILHDKLFQKDYALSLLLLTGVLFLGQFDHYFLTLQQGQLLFALVVGLCWMTLFTPSDETIL